MSTGSEGVVMVAVGVGSAGTWAAGVAVTFVLAVVFVISSVFNTVFLIIFARRPALRSISNRFIVSLTVCNLAASWVLLPLVLADTWIPGHGQDPTLCRTLDAVAELVASASVFATLLIAIDRFCAITDPLHYHMLVTRAKSAVMIAGAWLFALGIAAMAALGDLSGRTWNVCSAASTTSTSNSTTPAEKWSFRSYFVVVNLVVSFAIPMVLLIWIYVGIYRAAHKNSERTRRNSLCGATLDAVTPSRAPSRTPSTRSTSSQIVTTLRHRISNASLFLHKEESRAAKISVVVIVLFFLCWLPYYTAALLHTTLVQVWVPGLVQSIVMILVLSNSAISPYLYLYRSRRIQREVRRLMGLPLCTKSPGGSSRRRPPNLRLHLEMIPPSPTMPDANFDAALDPYLVVCKDPRAATYQKSPLAVLFNKLFRAKGFTWDSWRDSSTSSSSSTATTSSTATSTSSSTSASNSTEYSTPESESMLPRVASPSLKS